MEGSKNYWSCIHDLCMVEGASHAEEPRGYSVSRSTSQSPNFESLTPTSYGGCAIPQQFVESDDRGAILVQPAQIANNTPLKPISDDAVEGGDVPHIIDKDFHLLGGTPCVVDIRKGPLHNKKVLEENAAFLGNWHALINHCALDQMSPSIALGKELLQLEAPSDVPKSKTRAPVNAAVAPVKIRRNSEMRNECAAMNDKNRIAYSSNEQPNCEVRSFCQYLGQHLSDALACPQQQSMPILMVLIHQNLSEPGFNSLSEIKLAFKNCLMACTDSLCAIEVEVPKGNTSGAKWDEIRQWMARFPSSTVLIIFSAGNSGQESETDIYELVKDALGPCYQGIMVENDAPSRGILILSPGQFCEGHARLNKWCEAVRRAHFTWVIGFKNQAYDLELLRILARLVWCVCSKRRSALVLDILQSSTVLSAVMEHANVLIIMELPESCINTHAREIVRSKPGASAGQGNVGYTIRPFPPATE